jgi:ABC-2 type transport system ATP-binding protein
LNEPAIELQNVGKRYSKIVERSLLRSMIPLGPPNRSTFWALRDIDLRVERGETVGLIGRNGAGKSTLLRLLAGVSQPTTGRLTVRGRIAPLLSVGVGFHLEMTGRENVLVNAMLLGLTKSEIAARFDEMVAFAGLAEFIDTPVKFYSSGMFMRLGFSVAIHVEPDVLIVDEVLAVGDVGFQLRCLDRMRALQQSGTTIIFVSHSMHTVQVLCPRAILLHRGQIELDGPAEVAIGRYHELLNLGDEIEAGAAVHVVERALLVDGAPVQAIDQDSMVTYRTTLRFEREIDGPQLVFGIVTEDGSLAYGKHTTIGDGWRSFSAGEEATVEVAFWPRLGGGGTFRIAVSVMDDAGKETLFQDRAGPSFYVPPRLGVTGVADLEASILIDGVSRTAHTPLRLDGG